jgi:Zn-dependent protease with chaperone function
MRLVCLTCGAAIADRRRACPACGQTDEDSRVDVSQVIKSLKGDARQPQSLMLRALLAILLLAGFYVIALLGIVLLAGVLYFEMKVVQYGSLGITMVCIVGIISILWAIVPRSDPFRPHGVRLAAKRQPRLFALLAGVAASTGQRVPSDVYLVPEVNAWVASHGGVLGLGSRRTIGIGLPLLSVLTVSELRAVLVHEFGHYYGGDTALGPLVYGIRAIIGRTIGALEGAAFLNLPFEIYGEFYLQLTQSVSRQQERSADRIACLIAGPRAFAEGLRKIHTTALVAEDFWDSQVQPVVDAGFLPPLAEGFNRFVNAPVISSRLTERAALLSDQESDDPNDSHPLFRERLAIAATYPSDSFRECTRTALTLVDAVENTEARLLATMIDAKTVNSLELISWDVVGERVYLAKWVALREKHARILARLSTDSLASLGENVMSIASDLGLSLSYCDTARRQVAEILGGILAATLTKYGWAPQVLPGPRIVCQSGEHSFEPIAAIHRVATGQMSGSAWRQECAALGISGIPLVPR